VFYHGRDAGKTEAVEMTRTQLASRLDAMVTRPDALAPEVHKVAADAMLLAVACVFAPPVWTARLATMLRGSTVAVGSLVAFPHGTSKSTIKAIEATSTIKDGADRIEIVPHLPHVLSLDLDGARAELIEILRAARATRRDVTVATIIDIGLVMRRGAERTERSLEAACRATRESGCDGIVLAGDATADALALVKRYSEGLSVKVVTNDPAAAFAAGADRAGVENLQALLES
jgi:deoxyribose-phosphate aldolase